ncbi:MAG: DUF4468 domain-containing protein [Bacteroidetes bacterium]|nr:DUF4468 domain-containing protein [Bacteroidota bacterium]
MKKILLLVAGLFFLQMGYSQELTGVVPVEGKTANKLFDFAREWFALNFQSSKDEVKLADSSNRVFIVVGERRAPVEIKGIRVTMKMSFTLRLEFKEGRFKYEFRDIDYRNAITNQSHDIETFKECSTVSGLEAFYKRNSIPKFLEGKKEQIAATNGKNYAVLKAMPQDVIDDLTHFLKQKKNENW